MANSEDPDQTAPLEEQSDLGLHCLPRPICPKTLDHYNSVGLKREHTKMKYFSHQFSKDMLTQITLSSFF